jgi:hypothetical protein
MLGHPSIFEELSKSFRFKVSQMNRMITLALLTKFKANLRTSGALNQPACNYPIQSENHRLYELSEVFVEYFFNLMLYQDCPFFENVIYICF